MLTLIPFPLLVKIHVVSPAAASEKKEQARKDRNKRILVFIMNDFALLMQSKSAVNVHKNYF